jgi:acyl carrier protein
VQGCYQAPQSEWERRLAGLWGQVLGLPAGQVGLLDNFFHLGGNSLKTIQLVARIREEFGVEVPVTAVFEHSTVQDLARHCLSGGSHDPVRPAHHAQLHQEAQEQALEILTILEEDYD